MKRLVITDKEHMKVILGALENQIWTIDAAKQKHIGIEDEELDRQRAEVEQVFLAVRKKVKGY